jgi:SAM-dependent methyltransferase
MRKDYVAVDTTTEGLDEASFVERFWTDTWRDCSRPADASMVASREEYRVIRPYLERLPKGSRILDGGCGMGEWTIFLAQQGFDVTGLDISQQTIARLRDWFPERTFTHGDLRRTPFADASFDAYFSWGAFEHFECGLGGCVSEARRIVRPGGWLFVSVPFYNRRLVRRDRWALERWDENFDPLAGYRTPLRFYQWRLTRSEFQRELEIHGFRVDAIKPISKLTGAGRMLQWDLPLFAKGSRSYAAATRALALLLPSSFISHMILAAAERR